MQLPKKKKKGFLARLRFFLFAGILFTAPAGTTIWLTWEFLTATNSLVWQWILPFLPDLWKQPAQAIFSVPGVGLVIILSALTLLGFVVAGAVGNFLTQLMTGFLHKMPLVSTLYGWTRQLLETVLSSREEVFRKAVMVQYPYEDSWTMGFLIGRTKGEVAENLPEDCHNVFVPATPNPTTGFLLFVPEKSMRVLDMDVKEAFKYLLSVGIATPQFLQEEKKETAPSFGVRVFRKLRNALFAGLLITAPLFVSLWLAWKFLLFVDETLLPLLPEVLQPSHWFPFTFPGLGILLALVLLILVGFVSTNFMGRLLTQVGDGLLYRTPIVRGVYKTLKEIFQTIFSQDDEKSQSVALISYPRPGIWSLALVSGKGSKALGESPGDAQHWNLFLPTTPNPTSGFLLFQRPSQVIPLSMTVEEALKMVISLGIVVPKTTSNTLGKTTSKSGENPVK